MRCIADPVPTEMQERAPLLAESSVVNAQSRDWTALGTGSVGRSTMDVSAVHRAWHDRDGEYSPGYYAYYGPNETSEAIGEVIESQVPEEPSILELGCSSGRHLAFLYQEGYRDLSGIDINPDAISVMRETYPDLAAAGTFYVDAIENVLPEFEDGAFDVVFSVETLQHIHHDQEWVFEEIARITDGILVTVELEGDGESEEATNGDHGPTTYVKDDIPLYRRNWERVFTPLGFEAMSCSQLGRDTMRVFRRER